MHSPTSEPSFPRLVPVADRALLVEFGDRVDEAVHAAVLAFDDVLRDVPVCGLVEVVPSMVNVMLVFDPRQTDHERVVSEVGPLLHGLRTSSRKATEHEVQVCYDPEFGRDLETVAAQTGQSVEAVISTHLAGDYSVYMYGFAPGYAYLSGVPESIRIARKPAPVRGVPAGSVIIAGGQCLITTLTMPTGWWIIGRSPARVLTGQDDRPFLFDVGDKIRFRRVGPDALSSVDGS